MTCPCNDFERRNPYPEWTFCQRNEKADIILGAVYSGRDKRYKKELLLQKYGGVDNPPVLPAPAETNVTDMELLLHTHKESEDKRNDKGTE